MTGNIQQAANELGITIVHHSSTGVRTYQPDPGHRPLSEIARDIRRNWTKPYFGAVPYLDALGTLNSITDTYYADDAEDVVRYFLANAGTWRGETARAIKAELNSILKAVK